MFLSLGHEKNGTWTFIGIDFFNHCKFHVLKDLRHICTQRSYQGKNWSETVQQIGNRARNEAKEIMQPTYIPEIKSGPKPRTAELINVNQRNRVGNERHVLSKIELQIPISDHVSGQSQDILH